MAKDPNPPPAIAESNPSPLLPMAPFVTGTVIRGAGLLFNVPPGDWYLEALLLPFEISVSKLFLLYSCFF